MKDFALLLLVALWIGLIAMMVVDDLIRTNGLNTLGTWTLERSTSIQKRSRD